MKIIITITILTFICLYSYGQNNEKIYAKIKVEFTERNLKITNKAFVRDNLKAEFKSKLEGKKDYYVIDDNVTPDVTFILKIESENSHSLTHIRIIFNLNSLPTFSRNTTGIKGNEVRLLANTNNITDVQNVVNLIFNHVVFFEKEREVYEEFQNRKKKSNKLLIEFINGRIIPNLACKVNDKAYEVHQGNGQQYLKDLKEGDKIVFNAPNIDFEKNEFTYKNQDKIILKHTLKKPNPKIRNLLFIIKDEPIPKLLKASINNNTYIFDKNKILIPQDSLKKGITKIIIDDPEDIFENNEFVYKGKDTINLTYRSILLTVINNQQQPQNNVRLNVGNNDITCITDVYGQVKLTTKYLRPGTQIEVFHPRKEYLNTILNYSTDKNIILLNNQVMVTVTPVVLEGILRIKNELIPLISFERSRKLVEEKDEEEFFKYMAICIEISEFILDNNTISTQDQEFKEAIESLMSIIQKFFKLMKPDKFYTKKLNFIKKHLTNYSTQYEEAGYKDDIIKALEEIGKTEVFDEIIKSLKEGK